MDTDVAGAQAERLFKKKQQQREGMAAMAQ